MDEDNCNEEYKKNGLIPKKTSFLCQLLHHNQDSVMANLSREVGTTQVLFFPKTKSVKTFDYQQYKRACTYDNLPKLYW